MKAPRTAIRTLGAAWNRYWFSPEPVIGLALFRIAFGLSAAIFHLPRVRFIADLYTPAGFMAPEQLVSWLSIVYPLPLPLAYAANILLLAAICALILGYRTRAAAGAVFTIHTYLTLVEHFMGNGLTQIISIFALLLAFSPAGEFLSLDARRRFGSVIPHPIPRAPRALARVILWQLAAIYVSNAMLKITHGFGPWIRGDTIVWILQNPAWSQPWARPLAAHFAGPLRTVTAIAFIAYLFLGVGLLWKKTRPYAAVFGLSWHLAAFLLAVIAPGWLALVSAYLLLVEPVTWEYHWNLLRRNRLPKSHLFVAACLVIAFVIAAISGRTAS